MFDIEDERLRVNRWLVRNGWEPELDGSEPHIEYAENEEEEYE